MAIGEERKDNQGNSAKPEKVDMLCITLTAATPRLALSSFRSLKQTL